MFSVVFLAENCFLISRTFLHSCDKTAEIDQVFTEYANSCLFPRLPFYEHFLLYFLFLCPEVYNLIKNSSSTEVVNIACNFVVLLWRRKCQKLVRLKTTEILRSNLLITKNIYLGSVNIIVDNKIA